eukprot:4285090-Pyramimonas_sp.AAC.1
MNCVCVFFPPEHLYQPGTYPCPYAVHILITMPMLGIPFWGGRTPKIVIALWRVNLGGRDTFEAGNI